MPIYRIEGAKKDTAEDIAYEVEAVSEAAAIAAVEPYAMVASVVRLPDPLPEVPVSTGGHVEGTGAYAVNVVGESNYQQALAFLCGGKTADGHHVKTAAALVCETGNPHDPNAVAVVIGGYLVGYLDREAARSYRQQLLAAGQTGATLSCDALIVGGWIRPGGDEGAFGVKIDLPTQD